MDGGRLQTLVITEFMMMMIMMTKMVVIKMVKSQATRDRTGDISISYSYY